MKMQREAGILFPVFSLPSRFGIGCFSKEAYAFIDFLARSGQSYWQILPIGPTGFGDSPYQPFSAFAGNPYFICLETLIEEGLLTWDEVNSKDFGSDQERVDYGRLYENRFPLLSLAHERFLEKGLDREKAYKDYCKKESFWLEDYALFMAIKGDQGGKPWTEWDAPLRKRDKTALAEAKKRLAKEISSYEFRQFKFDEQWHKLHAYAAEKNIRIIGDLPFYTALDSADVWAHPEAFLMNKDLTPSVVAGCPPDAFSATGQLWGNPIYDWNAEKKRGFSWWIARIRRNYEFYDVIRIDHFHGFAEYYAIPFKDTDALHGKMHRGPGMDFFRAVREQLGDVPMIAEDLGNNTPEKEKLLADSGLPGMKVLQFAFTSWNSAYTTHKHIKNCVVYTGTHDNTPSRAWIEEINDGERDFVRRYTNSMDTDYGRFVWDFIREAYRSVADLCIIPLTDYLVKGREARINTPGRAEDNWQWRLKPDFLSEDLAQSIRRLADTYDRLPKPEETGKTKEKAHE